MTTVGRTAHPLPEQIDAGELTIRRWRAVDSSAMTEMISTSIDHLRPWMAWARDEPLTADARLRQFQRWDRYWASGDGVVYGVFHDGAPIGGCALHRRVGPGGLDIGYWLAASAIGRGYATQIVEALTRAACAVPDVTFTQISHASHNQASAGVAQRLSYDRSAVGGGRLDTFTTWRHDCAAAALLN